MRNSLMHVLLPFALVGFCSVKSWSADKAQVDAKTLRASLNIEKICNEDSRKYPGKYDKKLIEEACNRVQVADNCFSVENRPIYHYDRSGQDSKSKRILVISLIHGDETHAGTVGRYWMQRLEGMVPRNSWRVMPITNPDGFVRKTRTNANKIDLNRNFPTADWGQEALKYWQEQMKSNPRRFPGKLAGSEPEVNCLLGQIESYKPDFIVSVHTPLKVLDYDGPKISKPPKFDYLPWKTLGHMPGSLGRYMWFERQTPVLTMELKEDLPSSFTPFEQLQDIIGFLVQMDEKPDQTELHKQETKESVQNFSANNNEHEKSASEKK